jgi:signal transduction histidine kinase
MTGLVFVGILLNFSQIGAQVLSDYNPQPLADSETYEVQASISQEDEPQSSADSLLAALAALTDNDLAEKAELYIQLEDVYMQNGRQDAALRYSKLALDAFRTLADDENYLYQLIRVSLALRSTGAFGESLEYLVESLQLARARNEIDAEVESLLAMGFIYAFVEKWDEAFESQQLALKIYEQTGDSSGIARIHNDLGVTYYLADDLDAALAQHQAALDLRLNMSNGYDIFSSYTYIGDIHATNGNYIAAIEVYETAMSYKDQVDFKTMVVSAYQTLGVLYARTGDVSRARANLTQALQMSNEIGDLSGASQANLVLARLYMAEGAFDLAIDRLRRAERTAPTVNIQIRSELYAEIANVYYRLGDYRNAYLNSLTYADLIDSVLTAQNLSKIARLNTVMAFENELALKRESNERIMAVKQAEVDRERFTRNIFLIGMLFAVGLMVATYIRFVEKNKLNQKLNETLSNLRATQSQLVQQEKLASLGQLTAGIAHEIKNPLNFVNNFAEVSLEMIEELHEAVDKATRPTRAADTSGLADAASADAAFSDAASADVTLSDAASADVTSSKATSADKTSADKTSADADTVPFDLDEAKASLNDIRINLTKIHEHGTRADTIVKSMLLHSRGSSGKPVPVNLNALVSEYTNLAFHGMRAGKHPINVDIDLQLEASVGDVPLIAEDFSRVIINLCNNAFDAMRDKESRLKQDQGSGSTKTSRGAVQNVLDRDAGLDASGVQGSQAYKPNLSVRTRSTDRKVIIEIEDNGPGIPNDIKDKILQPFFTTKKGTQGTGLGLSITHDIVKAHGGNLEVESGPGGSVFKIYLPQ